MVEIVGADRVVNAVALNSVVVHCSRILGPALAGTIIALVGIAPCFLVNAFSFLAMFIALRTMNARELRTPKPVARAKGELRSALRYVRGTPELLIPLLMMALVGTISFNFQVLLPLLADFTWNGTATTYAMLTASMGVGSRRRRAGRGRARAGLPRAAGRLARWPSGSRCCWPRRRRRWSCRSLALIPLGAASVTFAAGVNSALQIHVEPTMRGRVMALYSVVFLGSTPIGAPLVGWLAEAAGPRAGLVAGAVAALLAGFAAWFAFARRSEEPVVARPHGGRVRAPKRLAAVRDRVS